MKHKKKIFFLIILLLIFLRIFFNPIYTTFTNSIEYINRSLLNVKSKVYENNKRTYAILENKNNISNLLDEIDKLKEEKSHYDMIEVENTRLSLENEKLKEELQIYSEHKSMFVVAKTILTENNLKNDIIYINVGKNFNIKENQPVLYKNILIGITSYVDENFSEVELLTNIDMKIGVSVDGNLAILRGAGDNKYKIYNYNYPKKDLYEVRTSGLSLVFPKNLLIGYYKNENEKDYEKYHTLEFRTKYNISDIEYVGVYTGGLDNNLQLKIEERDSK